MHRNNANNLIDYSTQQPSHKRELSHDNFASIKKQGMTGNIPMFSSHGVAPKTHHHKASHSLNQLPKGAAMQPESVSRFGNMVAVSEKNKGLNQAYSSL